MNEANTNTAVVRATSEGEGAGGEPPGRDAFGARETSSGGDWGTCDARWIKAVVVSISGMGGAVTFGLTRDMGAHSLTLMLNGNKKTLWFEPGDDLAGKLEEVYLGLAAIP